MDVVMRPAAAALLGGWLAAFVIVKGASPQASIEANTFWRLLMPAWPAYLLLLAAIPLLVPTLARRLGRRVAPPAIAPTRGRLALAAAAALCVVPLALVALLPALDSRDELVLNPEGDAFLLTPVLPELTPSVARTEAGGVRLTWRAASWRTTVGYRVYRSADPAGDLVCEREGVLRCTVASDVVRLTREHTWIDPSPPAGAVYRIGVTASYDPAAAGGDVFALSPSVAAP